MGHCLSCEYNSCNNIGPNNYISPERIQTYPQVDGATPFHHSFVGTHRGIHVNFITLGLLLGQDLPTRNSPKHINKKWKGLKTGILDGWINDLQLKISLLVCQWKKLHLQDSQSSPSTPKNDLFQTSPAASSEMYTSHGMKDLAFHSLLRWKMITLSNSHYLTYTFLFKRLGECTFIIQEWKVPSTHLLVEANHP